MSRNPQLEALLQAKFDLDHCAHEERERFLRHFHELLDQVLARRIIPELTRERVEELLREPIKSFGAQNSSNSERDSHGCDKQVLVGCGSPGDLTINALFVKILPMIDKIRQVVTLVVVVSDAAVGACRK